MKLLLLSHQFPPQPGGIGQWAWSLAASWPDACVCQVPPAPPEERRSSSLHHYEVDLNESIAPKTLRQLEKWVESQAPLAPVVRDLWLSLDWPLVRRTLNGLLHFKQSGIECDLILSASAQPSGILGSMISGLTGKPHAVLVHGAELLAVDQDVHRNKWTLDVLHQADLCIANSHYTRELLLSMNIDPDQIVVSHPGVNDAILNSPPPERAEKQSLNLLTVANLVPRKGHARVIGMLPRLVEHFPGLTYTVVGQGPERDRLEALARQLNVDARCFFMGRVSTQELEEIYASADCFIMPGVQYGSEVEGFGIAFAEASAHGLPVIGSDIGGCSDAILQDETGFLIPPDDDDMLYVKIQQLLSDPELRRRLGQAGRRRVQQALTWQKSTETLARHINQKLDARRGRS